MACPDRRSARDLIAELQEDGSRFRFFQAIRLLALSSEEQDLPPEVRFRTPVSLAFPASEILDAQAIRPQETGGERSSTALELTVGFMGMTGPSGALPSAYTEALIERRNFHRDTAAHSFLDTFTHRSISLFYQAWRKPRFHIRYEAGDRGGFTRNVLDLMGVGLSSMQPALQSRSGAPGMLLSHFAGLLAQRPVSATNLAALLRGYFCVQVTVEQFVGQWVDLPDSEQSRLGSENCALGETASIGQRLWDRQNKINLRIGPLNADQFADLLPGQPGAQALAGLVEFCVGQTLACDATLILSKECVPPAVLTDAGSGQLRLGHNTWLHRDLPEEHQDNTCFSILS